MYPLLWKEADWPICMYVNTSAHSSNHRGKHEPGVWCFFCFCARVLSLSRRHLLLLFFVFVLSLSLFLLHSNGFSKTTHTARHGSGVQGVIWIGHGGDLDVVGSLRCNMLHSRRPRAC